MAIITIFGLAGTGTSTCGKLLAEKLGYKFISTGNLMRQMAQSMNMDLYQFERHVHEDPQTDREFDKKIEQMGKEQDALVIDSRLAWYFIPHSLKIKFKCSDEIRIKRVSQRDGIDETEAKDKTFERENNHTERYCKIYGLKDYSADENFDFVIETDSLLPEQIVEVILKIFQDELF